MLFLSRVKFVLDSRLLSYEGLSRAFSSNTCQKLINIGNIGQTNPKYARKFSSGNISRSNSMSLLKSASKINSTLESGTINVVKVPNMGKNIDKCKIYKWVKKPGDYVNVDDLICIIETDLVFGKVYSRLSGTIIENVNQEGSVVSVGSDLAVLVNNQMLHPGSGNSESSSFNAEQKRAFSTLKYVPSISFSRCKLVSKDGRDPKSASSAADNGSNSSAKATGNPKGVQVLDDFYKSPYRSWFKSISEEEISAVNQGTVDVK